MRHTISRKLGVFVWIIICFAAIIPCRRLEATDSAAVKRQFSDPPREYHSAPLWVWNDMLTDEQIVGTMRDLAGQQEQLNWAQKISKGVQTLDSIVNDILAFTQDQICNKTEVNLAGLLQETLDYLHASCPVNHSYE